MSYDDEFFETIDESLDEQWWLREQEEPQSGVELYEDHILLKPESYENVIDEHIDYANDEKQIQQSIIRLEELRLELSDLRRRKIRVFNILTEHIEKGLVSDYLQIKGRVDNSCNFIKKIYYLHNLFVKNCFMV